jgi:glucose-1-phosphate adenylyltransferase
VIAAESDGRVRGFQEKPEKPAAMPGDPRRAFASMGNYLFSTEVLLQALCEAHDRGESDFGRHILPRLMTSHRLYAYDFSSNTVPGIKPYEEPTYWRDVGNIDSYFTASHDVLGLEPLLDAFNPRWPIYSAKYQGPVAKVIAGEITNSLFAAGTVINGAKVHNSILRHEVFLEEGVSLDDCIIMDNVRIKRGARLKRVIVDRYNTIPANARIGFDAAQDRARYTVSESGVVVVPSGRSGARTRSFATRHL